MRLIRRSGKLTLHPDKVKKVLEEFETGTLHSGSKRGPLITNRKQAIAIGLSEQRKRMR